MWQVRVYIGASQIKDALKETSFWRCVYWISLFTKLVSGQLCMIKWLPRMSIEQWSWPQIYEEVKWPITEDEEACPSLLKAYGWQ